MFEDKNILITGGTGSFGKKCVEILLNQYKPRRVIVFSRDELKQFEMAQMFPVADNPAIRYFIGDVRDKERLHRALQGVHYVIHAAAMKQVPAAEYNPTECIRTNISGAENIVNVAADVGVERVVALSTDKAVNPVNLYGATKLCSDKLFVAANAYIASKTMYSVVRYGNVMGSRGSVIPFFIDKRSSGTLPITDPAMTRFWITLEEGVALVLQALLTSVGGEIYVPKIPSMNIMDLAKAIAPECKTEVVGIRPGEKLHEVMITREDARNTIDMGDHYVIKPDPGLLCVEGMCEGKAVPCNFEYNSDGNEDWLSVEDLRDVLLKQGFNI